MKLTEKFQIERREQAQRENFVELTHEDIELLRYLLPFMERHVDGIVAQFYAHLLKYSEARAFFKDEESLSRMKSAQREYLLDLFRGNYGDDYYENRLQLGVAQVQIGLLPKWYLGSNSKLLCLIVSLLAQKYRLRPQKLARYILALNKVMNLDQQLIIDTYIGTLLEQQKGSEKLPKQMKHSVGILVSSPSEILATAEEVQQIHPGRQPEGEIRFRERAG